MNINTAISAPPLHPPAAASSQAFPNAESSQKNDSVRYSQGLNPVQLQRLKAILYRKEPHTIVPKNHDPHGLYKKIEFDLIEFLNFLSNMLREKNILKDPHCLIGGAASHVICDFEYNDIDICFFIKRNEKDFSQEFTEFDFILESIRKYICYKLKIQYLEKNWKLIKQIDNNYLYKKIKIDNIFSYVGLGDIDVKFILNDRFRKSVSSSDGFHISLGDKHEIFCYNGDRWCSSQEEFDTAKKELLCRILTINNLEVDDLAIRVALKMTHCFKVESQEKLATAAFNELVKKIPISNPAKCKELLERYKKHQENHYPSHKHFVGHLFDLLNLCSFLLKNESAERIVVHQYIALLAQSLEKNPLAKLLMSDPLLADKLLAFVRGILFYEWSKAGSTLEAYDFKFCETEQTPRLYLGYPRDGRVYYLALEESPLETAKKFFSSWKELQEYFEKKNELSKWNDLLNFLGTPLCIKELSQKQLAETSIELCQLMLKPPLSTVIATKFKPLRREVFYNALLRENISGLNANFVQRSRLESQFSDLQQNKQHMKLDAAADQFLSTLRNCISTLESSNIQTIQKIIKDLNATIVHKSLDGLIKNPIYLDLINDSLMEMTRHFLSFNDLNLLETTQELCTLAFTNNLLSNPIACKAACMILSACKVKQIGKSPLYLTQMDTILKFTEHWEKRSEELIAISNTIRSSIDRQSLVLAQKCLNNLNSSLGVLELPGRCVHIALKAPQKKEDEQQFLDIFMKIAKYAFSTKNENDLKLAYEVALKILIKKFPLGKTHLDVILQLGQLLLDIPAIKGENGKPFVRAAIDLFMAISMGNLELGQTIKLKLLEVMGNCLLFTPSDRKQDHFHLVLEAFGSLNLLNDEQLKILYGQKLNISLPAAIKNFIEIAAVEDFPFTINYASRKEIKLLFPREEFANMHLMMLNLKSGKNFVKNLTHKFTLWSSISSSEIPTNSSLWTSSFISSIELLTQMSEQQKKHDKQIKKVLTYVLLEMEKCQKQPASWIQSNARALQQPLSNLIKSLATQNSDHLAKKIHAAAISCNILQVCVNNPVKNLLRNIARHNNASAIKQMLVDFTTNLKRSLSAKEFKQSIEALDHFLLFLKSAPVFNFWIPEMHSLIAEMISIDPKDLNEDKKIQEFILLILSTLRQKNHIKYFPESVLSEYTQAIVKRGLHWKNEGIWKETGQFPKTMNQTINITIKSPGSLLSGVGSLIQSLLQGPLSLYFDTLKEASLCHDIRLFNWIKKEILDRNFLDNPFTPASERAKGYRHLYQHISGLCSISSPKDSENLISLLKDRWYSVFQIPSVQIEQQQIFSILLHVLTRGKNHSNHIEACRLLCLFPQYVHFNHLILLLHSILDLPPSPDMSSFRLPCTEINIRTAPPFECCFVELNPNHDLMKETFPHLLEFIVNKIIDPFTKIATFDDTIDTALFNLIKKTQRNDYSFWFSSPLLMCLMKLRIQHQVLLTEPKAQEFSSLFINNLIKMYNLNTFIEMGEIQEFYEATKKHLNERQLLNLQKCTGDVLFPILNKNLFQLKDAAGVSLYFDKIECLIEYCRTTHKKEARQLISDFFEFISRKLQLSDTSHITRMIKILELADKCNIHLLPTLLDKNLEKSSELVVVAGQRIISESICIQKMCLTSQADFSQEVLKKLILIFNLTDFTKLKENSIFLKQSLLVHDRLSLSMMATQDDKLYIDFLTWWKSVLNQKMSNKNKLDILGTSYRMLKRLAAYQAVFKEILRMTSELVKIKPENVETIEILQSILVDPVVRTHLFDTLQKKFKKDAFGEVDTLFAVSLLTTIHRVKEFLPNILSDETAMRIDNLVIFMADSITKCNAAQIEYTQILLQKDNNQQPKSLSTIGLNNIVEFALKHLPKSQSDALIKKIVEIKKNNLPGPNLLKNNDKKDEKEIQMGKDKKDEKKDLFSHSK